MSAGERAALVPEQRALDFGISKVVGTGIDLTQTDRMLGTPAYMAPEQATGDRSSISARTDVFALAVITYRMVAGRLPFDATSIPPGCGSSGAAIGRSENGFICVRDETGTCRSSCARASSPV